MLTEPVGQVAAPDATIGEIEHEAFLVVHGSVDLEAVEGEERLHRGVAYALVAVDKWVGLNP
jgi:hypothetical protein